MSGERIESIVVIGGGAAAWLAAAALSRSLRADFCSVRVIDAPLRQRHPGSYAALPSFHRLNALLGINEEDLLENTHGTYSLGLKFIDWGDLGRRYFHSFGSIGAKLEAVPFHHYWMKLRQLGEGGSFESYSTASMAAGQSRFAMPLAERSSVLSTYSYGYHFDGDLLTEYLRAFCLAHGVERIQGEVMSTRLTAQDGTIEALKLRDGAEIVADFYIDCSGEQQVLSRLALNCAFEDWSCWLPCDRLFSHKVPWAGATAPCAHRLAQPSGWSFRTPLRGHLDCGMVYSHHFGSAQQALQTMMQGVAGNGSEIIERRYAPGRPRKFWERNCLLLAGNHWDPLESTELHLVQTGIARFLTLFPRGGVNEQAAAEYNRLTIQEHERIRDFLTLHFKASVRVDSPLWRHCRDMAVPDTLQTKLELFKRCGRIALGDEEHFGEESWLALFFGQGVEPEAYDPLADVLEVAHVRDALSHLRSLVAAGVATLPPLSQFMAGRGAPS